MVPRQSTRLVHVCGSPDPALGEQTRVAERRYKEMGGDITVVVRDGDGRVRPGSPDVGSVVAFVTGRR